MTRVSLQNGQVRMTAPRSSRQREIPAHFTLQQRNFVVAVRDTDRHLVLRATAGSGKTTTLTEAAWHLDASRPCVYFAYNKHSVIDVGARLPPRVWASTLHAYGRRVLCRERQTQLDVDEDKSLRLAGLLYEDERAERRVVRATARVWDAAREYALDGDAHEDDLVALALAAEWPQEQGLTVLRRVLHGMRHFSLQDWQKGGLPDFGDFLWLPLELGYAKNTLSVALVDEAQDLTPGRQRFIKHLLGLDDSARPGRLIAVGDPEQAIYSYAGADPQGLWRLAEQIGAQELPLSVSFRCPASHVALARSASSFIEPSPNARAGQIEHIEADQAVYTRGDVILSRLNAPLVRAALILMTRDISVNIRGRDLAVRLETAAQEAFPTPFGKDLVRDLVNVVYERRAKPLLTKAREGDLAAKKALGELKDLCACLRLLALRAVTLAGGTADVAGVSGVLRSLYHEDADVLLSTVHRAKGLEWDRVTILYPELMPSPHGDPEEERCVLFVALTRGKDTLRLAYGKESWANGWRLKPAEQVEGLEDVDAPHSVDAAVTPVLVSEITPMEVVAKPYRGQEVPAERVSCTPERSPMTPSVIEAVKAQQASAPTSARAAHVQRVREATRTQQIEDARSLPLFTGSDTLPVTALRERLETLLDEPRPALREWAESSLTLLRTVTGKHVQLDLGVLKQVERAASQARMAVPLSQSLTGSQVAVVVFAEHFARLRVGQVTRRGDRVWSVTVEGQALRFDPRTGEVLGEPFMPFGLHLRQR